MNNDNDKINTKTTKKTKKEKTTKCYKNEMYDEKATMENNKKK